MAVASRPTVLVLETQGKAALPIMESLARAGLRVAAGSDMRFNCGFYSRCCRERHRYPSARSRPDEFKAWLLRFLRRRPIKMLFPVGHYGTLAVSEIQDEVRRHTRLLLPPHDVFLRGYEKVPTMKAALAAGVPIPDSWFPSAMPGGLGAVSEAIRHWPVLIKPSVGVGARGITWCYEPDALRSQFPVVEAEYGPCYVQDFVPPGGMQYKVDMLVDDSQRQLAGVVYGKTRMYPPDGGSSVLNFSVHRPDILASAHRMVKELGWVGFCDFDFVEDPRDGHVKLMEINPRFPESFRMVTAVGMDVPRMMYALAHGEPVTPRTEYPKDWFLRFLPGDLLWFLRVNNARRFGTWPGWFRFLDARTTYQVCSVSDPGPILGYVLENLAVLLNRKARRARFRLDAGGVLEHQ